MSHEKKVADEIRTAEKVEEEEAHWQWETKQGKETQNGEAKDDWMLRLSVH